MGTMLHFRTIRLQSRGVKPFKRQSQSEPGGKVMMSVDSIKLNTLAVRQSGFTAATSYLQQGGHAEKVPGAWIDVKVG